MICGVGKAKRLTDLAEGTKEERAETESDNIERYTENGLFLAAVQVVHDVANTARI
jgi:hypothetical protein